MHGVVRQGRHSLFQNGMHGCLARKFGSKPGKYGGLVVNESEEESKFNQVALDEFCCLFWGFETRCATCPLPKAVQDLFDDGTLNPKSFRKFGKRQTWRDEQQAFSQHDASLVEEESMLSWCLNILGLKEMPRRRTELKRVYIQKAKSLHPDTGGSAQAFRDLVRAYETALVFFKPGPRHP